MIATVSIGISIAAFMVSVATAWFTLLRRGTVRMTKPTVVFFGPDGAPSRHGAPAKPKVFLRSLVYSTGKRGHIIESMFVTLRRGETRQTFNIWIYDQNGLARGSGVYVGETGVVCNHHFLLPEDGMRFEFLAGDYQLDVYAALVRRSASLHLCSVHLIIGEQAGRQLKDPERGIYFDWGQDAQRYQAHVRKKTALKENPLAFLVADAEASPR
ncbi:MAG TPA: hypothetical protein VHW71_05105 [Steroidobacteraceae bacterium]|jgi:hypothetical protein|nr:hypothetical protein [Steroidobacteraceae bacterium]